MYTNYNLIKVYVKVAYPFWPEGKYLDNPLKFRKNGGGVLIAINSSLQLSSKEISLKCKAEMLAVELMLNDNSKIVISTCYRVGTLGIPNFHEITRTLDILLRKKRLKKFFLIGDFNLRHANWETFSSSNSTEQTFINEFVRLGLIQCIFSPTHIKGNILDILLSNSDNFISDITILSNNESCKSDHYAITFKVKIKVVRKKHIKTKSFNFKRANWDGLNEDLNNVDWLLTLDCLEPDIAWSKFKEILNHFQELHIPKVTIKLKSQPPWFDTECYVKCREKERLHKKFKNTKSINDELKFVTCRREFKSLVRSKMRDNLYCSRDSNIITKKFWSHVKSKSKSCRIPEVIRNNSSISSDNVAKANMFNKYFFEQFSNTSTYDTTIDFTNDDAYDIDFSCTRIKNLLDNINVNKAPGPDGIHGNVLKFCSMSLCRPLSIIFKLCYNTGIIPSEWKSANIVPIYKQGDKAVVSNYRPISLICLTAKIMEQIIQDEFLCRTQEFIGMEQHGFLSSRSCSSNLVTLTDNIASNLYNDIGTDIIYFDFAKAFDSVNHDLLLSKLKNKFNIDARLLKFLVNYLKNRRQRVTLENECSDFLPVQSGVPQGSILGPLLFVFFINDIKSGINPKTSIALFADDTKIWRPMENEEDCAILQSDIEYLYHWSKQNQMKFHPAKCKVVSIVRKINRLSFLRLLPMSRFNYTLNDNILDYVTQQKDLGVIVNENLT